MSYHLLILLDLTEPIHARLDSGLIIEKILLKQTSLSSVWGLRGGWNGDTFGCKFQCGGSYIRASQSIVQVTHSHNPYSPRKIDFNYSYQTNNTILRS